MFTNSAPAVLKIFFFILRFILPTKPIKLEATKSHGIEVSHPSFLLSFFVIFVAEVFNQIYRCLEGSGRTPGPQWNRPESREGRQESAHPVLQVREKAIPPQVCQRYMDN